MMIRTSLATLVLAGLAGLGCSDDAPGADAAVDSATDAPTKNPARLWLKAVEIVQTVELVPTEPVPY
jgi:hypothetical protein